MKRMQAQIFAASLTMATAMFSHAENGDRDATNTDTGQSVETTTITSDYFVANWALFSIPGPSRPSGYDDAEAIATSYFDANWRIGAGPHSTPTTDDGD